jgi:hypothetical protein
MLKFVGSMREKIDSVELTEEDIDFFEAIRQKYVTKKIRDFEIY